MIATIGDRGLAAALALHERRRRDRRRRRCPPRPAPTRPCSRDLEEAGIPHLRGARSPALSGAGGSRAPCSPTLDAGGRSVPDSERGLNCDLIAVSGGTVPATSLLLQAGAKARWDAPSGSYLPEDPPAGIDAAGAVAGHARTGARAGLGSDRRRRGGARARARATRTRAGGSRTSARRWRPSRPAPRPIRARPRAATGARGRIGKCFACLCEDVTSKDIDYAIDEGFDSLELLKRYTTVTMGPCQGRMCQLASIRQMSDHTGAAGGRGRADHGPPAVVDGADGGARGTPVRAGQALGRPRTPPRAGRQRALGRATGGGPTTTAIPEGETMAVHDGAGLIDVSTLGKLIVSGPGGRRLPEPALPEPLRQPEAGADPLRGARRRRGPDHRRRDDLPARRGHATT